MRSARPVADPAVDVPEAEVRLPRTRRRAEVMPESPSPTASAGTPSVIEPAPAIARQPAEMTDRAARVDLVEGADQSVDPAPAPAPAPAVAPAPDAARQPIRNGHADGTPMGGREADGPAPGCTAPQLRRFIKSRAYVPMHELRRRFGIEGDDDDVTGVEVERDRRVYVGLPLREGRLLGELFRAGDVGYELSLDPITPIVVGVFPMRPIARG